MFKSHLVLYFQNYLQDLLGEVQQVESTKNPDGLSNVFVFFRVESEGLFIYKSDGHGHVHDMSSNKTNAAYPTIHHTATIAA